jgi:hypothetical protein
MKADSSTERSDSKKDLASSLKESVIMAVVYSVAAAAIYLIGQFYWWIGFILFIVFAFLVFQRLLVIGFVFFIELWSFITLFGFVRKRGMNLNRLDELQKPAGSLLILNLILAVFEIYLTAITALLGACLTFGWGDLF